MKDMSFQKRTPSPDYHPPYPLGCEPLVVLMVWRMITLRHLLIYPNPPLPYELLLEQRIAINFD